MRRDETRGILYVLFLFIKLLGHLWKYVAGIGTCTCTDTDTDTDTDTVTISSFTVCKAY
jgi:hypothetical protein